MLINLKSLPIEVTETQYGGTLTIVADGKKVAVLDYHRNDTSIDIQPIRIYQDVTEEDVLPLLMRRLYEVEQDALTTRYLYRRSCLWQHPVLLQEKGDLYIAEGIRVEKLQQRDAEADSIRVARLGGGV